MEKLSKTSRIKLVIYQLIPSFFGISSSLAGSLLLLSWYIFSFSLLFIRSSSPSPSHFFSTIKITIIINLISFLFRWRDQHHLLASLFNRSTVSSQSASSSSAWLAPGDNWLSCCPWSGLLLHLVLLKCRCGCCQRRPWLASSPTALFFPVLLD